jgi:hypothetical protein
MGKPGSSPKSRSNESPESVRLTRAAIERAHVKIVDPDTPVDLGAWSPAGKFVPAFDHLDHIHIRVKPRTQRHQ